MKYKITKEESRYILEYKNQKFEIDKTIKNHLEDGLKLSKRLKQDFDNIFKVLDDSSVKTSCPYEVRHDPLVSVILINYNGLEHNGACIESIHNQSYKNVEIIMVNNASDDGSMDIVKQKFPKVKIVDPKKNTGFARGNNIGARVSTGDYIFILNNDTELERDCIKNLVAFAQNRPEVGAFAAKMKFFWNKNVINSFGNTVFPDNWGSDNFINFIDIGQFNLPRQVMSACFGAVFIPRKVWEKVGELDSKMFMYYEDSDWSYRAKLLGYDIIASPYSIVYHKFGASTSTRPSQFKNKLVVQNRLIWAIKNLEKRMCLFTIKNYVKADVKDSLRFLRNGELQLFTSYLSAYFSLTLLLLRILANRLQIQKSRIVSDKEILALSVPINPEIYHSQLPRLTARTLRKYYSDNSFTIVSANWLNLQDSNWELWQDNPNFLVCTDGKPDVLEYEFEQEELSKFVMTVQGLFPGKCTISLNGKNVGNFVQKDGGIQNYLVGEVQLNKGINKLSVKVSGSGAVTYLGTISLSPVS